MINIIPIDIPKERLVHDLLCIRRSTSQTLIRLASEEFLEDGHGVAWHVDWVKWLIGENSVVDFVFVFAAEGRLLQEHLVDEHAEGPPIDGATVFLVEQDLPIRKLILANI